MEHHRHISLNPVSSLGNHLFQLGPELLAAVPDKGRVQVGLGLHDGGLELLLELVLDATEH